jgi:hypothetical protein
MFKTNTSLILSASLPRKPDAQATLAVLPGHAMRRHDTWKAYSPDITPPP